MRGYRDPGPCDEDDNFYLGSRFEDQFEEDQHGLLFRRFGRGAPVRVSYEERDDVSERIRRFDRARAITVGGVIGTYVVAEWVGGLGLHLGVMAPFVPAAAIMAVASVAWWVRRSFWVRLVSPFDRRAPVGPERTVRDQLVARASTISWSTALFMLMSAVFAVWVATENLSSRDTTDVADGVFAILAVATVATLVAAKLFQPRRRRNR